MTGDYFAGRLHDYGWESNKSLLSHGLIERDKCGRGTDGSWKWCGGEVVLVFCWCCFVVLVVCWW